MTQENHKTLMSTAQHLLHATIRIEGKHANGKAAAGTGFHIRLQIDGEFVPAIITNKHVLDGLEDCFLHLTVADEAGAPTAERMPFYIEAFKNTWISHPDPNIDLALLPIQPLLARVQLLNKRVFYVDLTTELIPTDATFASLSPIEEITMVGYPSGLWDAANNRPVVLRGITATACNSDYRGEAEFLIDAAVYPGSSGSPVFIFNQGAYTTSDGVAVGSRLLFIGVLSAVHLQTVSGEIKTIKVPTALGQVTLTQISNHLGVCVRASKIRGFIPVIREKIAALKEAAKAAS